jgi:molybdopterin synthase catalytic subunit
VVEKKQHTIFKEGPITASFIGESIAKHSSKTDIGAHSIFLGQVRNDTIDSNKVKAIIFSAYTLMANVRAHKIREEIFAKYPLSCMHIYHSLGNINAGEICLFVFASSPHRRAAAEACNEVVERIKSEVPIWGKEVFEDETYRWKKNN